MRTPALRRRITISGVLVLAGVVLVFDMLVYVSLRQRMEDALAELLDARMNVAVGLAEELEPDQLTRRLTELAVRARLRTPEGRVLRGEPATPRFGQVGPPTAPLHLRVERTVKFGDGTTLTVFATRAGLDATLRRLLLVLALGSAGAVVVAALLWRRVSATVIARRHARTSVQLDLACGHRIGPPFECVMTVRASRSRSASASSNVSPVSTARADPALACGRVRE